MCCVRPKLSSCEKVRTYQNATQVTVIPQVKVSERSVRQYVQERKQQLGLGRQEVFIPQTYEWGQEAQVDWYEATVLMAGCEQKVQIFSMRSMASGEHSIAPIFILLVVS